MEYIRAIILGLVQGLAEFLPISSSGHLVIASELLDFKEASLTFDIILHLGTLTAIFIFYYKDILGLVREFFLVCAFPFRNREKRGVFLDRNNESRILLIMIIIGSIPTALIGFLLKDTFAVLFGSVLTTGIALLITAFIIYLASKMNGTKEIKDIDAKSALLIGTFQGLAITPGISRSGSTLFGGLLCDLKKETAVRFSFLLSIPAILGAAILDFSDIGSGFALTGTMIVGFVVAAISGFFAIKLLLDLIKKKKLIYFSYYCLAIGLFAIIYSILI